MLASLLIILGLIFYLVASIGLLIVEFKEHILWGLLGLFTQIGHLIFIIVHFGKSKKCLGYMLLGFLLFILGFIMLAQQSSNIY